MSGNQILERVIKLANFTPQELEEILQQFFDVTGKRQYIGARYVPIFGRKNESSIEWDNSAPYEPLTIVLYLGNSYTSRTYVPAGVSIDDTYYWANTGNYNAQVEAYREETLRFSASIVQKPFFFDSVDEMKNSTELYDGVLCITSGFYSPNDNGGALYHVNTTDTANEMDVIQCSESLVATLVLGNEVNVLQLGAKNDDSSDASTILNRAIELADNNKSVYIPAGYYMVNSQITVDKRVSIHGEYSTSFNPVDNGTQLNVGSIEDDTLFLVTVGGCSISHLRIYGNDISVPNCTAIKLQYSIGIDQSSRFHCEYVRCNYVNRFFYANDDSLFTRLVQCLAYGCNVGYHIEAPTETNAQQCFAASCTTGWKLKNQSYSVYQNCAADQCDYAWDIDGCNTIVFIACSAEGSRLAEAFTIKDSKQLSFISCYCELTNSVTHGVSVATLDNSKVTMIGFRDRTSPNNDTSIDLTNSSLLELSGCRFIWGLSKDASSNISGSAEIQQYGADTIHYFSNPTADTSLSVINVTSGSLKQIESNGLAYLEIGLRLSTGFEDTDPITIFDGPQVGQEFAKPFREFNGFLVTNKGKVINITISVAGVITIKSSEVITGDTYISGSVVYPSKGVYI